MKMPNMSSDGGKVQQITTDRKYINSFPHNPDYEWPRVGMHLKRKDAFENISGKGENAGNQHFLLFPKFSLPFQKEISHLFCNLPMLSIWCGLKFCCMVKS